MLREGVTVNRPTQPDGITSIGDDCMLMAQSHVGHDCQVGNGVTLANNVMLAGHVRVGDGTFVGGGAGVHQFVRIGEGAMVGGNASIRDVPPCAIAAERNQIHGLNLVGIRRNKMPSANVCDLKRCYHEVYSGPGDLRARAEGLVDRAMCGMHAQGGRSSSSSPAATRVRRGRARGAKRATPKLLTSRVAQRRGRVSETRAPVATHTTAPSRFVPEVAMCIVACTPNVAARPPSRPATAPVPDANGTNSASRKTPRMLP